MDACDILRMRRLCGPVAIPLLVLVLVANVSLVAGKMQETVWSWCDT
jgi:hypothetical protein